MSLRLNGSTSGYVEIDAPAVAGTTSITLPATTGGQFVVTDASGNVNLDSGTLYVDATNNRVGIGTTSPSETLELSSTTANSAALKISRSTTLPNNLLLGTAGGDSFIRATGTASVYAQLIFESNNGTATQERARIDSSGRLLVGTSTSVDSNAKLQTYASSGTVLNHIESGSLANNTFAGCQIKAEGRIAQLAVYKHSGITNNCAFLYLQEENGTNAYIWADNSGVLRISATATHVGTTSGTVVGAQTSDERLKNILGPVEYGLETLKQLDPVRYSLKSEPETEKLGFIAQQVQPIIPQSVFDTNEHIEGEPEDAPTKLGMEYVALIPVLVNAIKELSDQNEALETRLTALEGGTAQ